MAATFLAFLGVSCLVIATPGPDTALTIRNTLRGGRHAGIATALGIAAGQTIWTLATSLGVAALLVAWEPLFLAVKYVGAAYLVYLGIYSLRGALWNRTTSQGREQHAGGRPLVPGRAFRQGLLSNLSNPKMAVFFASLLPQFATPGEGLLGRLVLLGIVFAAMTLSWLAAYSVLIAFARDRVRGSRLRRWIEAATGAMLIALGLRLAVEPR